VLGKHCKTQSEPTITGIFRHDGSEIQNALAFFAGGMVTETFYNRFGAVINNPLAYAAKTLQFSTKNFKGKIKGKGKASGKLRDQIHGQKGSKTDQNDYECGHWRDTWADVWAVAEQVWHEASDPWPKIDPRKGHTPIGSKGHPGKGKGKDRPDPPDRKGSGRGSSTHSNSHKNIGQGKSSRSDKRSRRHRRGSSEADDYFDFETISCAEYNEQWDRLKTLSQDEAQSWLDEQQMLRKQQEAPFPLKWPLPTESSKHGGPNLDSTHHFERAQTWKSVRAKIFDSQFPGTAFCPGCWHRFAIGPDLSPVEDRVIQHIESKIWDEDMDPPWVPLHPSPAAWCHLTANRISNDGPDTGSPLEAWAPGGIFAGDPSCGFSR
jgi:hypothetical protein